MLMVTGALALSGSSFASAAANKFEWHAGDAVLESLNPDFAPDVSMAANGDTVEVSGSGVFNAAARTATGGGTFAHFDSDGELFASGTWEVVSVISYRGYGNGVPQGLPPQFFGGLLVLSIVLMPDGEGSPTIPAIIAIDCLLGRPPATAEEGITLTVPGFITFDEIVGGATLFILT